VVVKDLEREAICDRSGDSQLADSGWAVEEQQTRGGHPAKYAMQPR
jgi:hypothetical protein